MTYDFSRTSPPSVNNWNGRDTLSRSQFDPSMTSFSKSGNGFRKVHKFRKVKHNRNVESHEIREEAYDQSIKFEVMKVYEELERMG